MEALFQQNNEMNEIVQQIMMILLLVPILLLLGLVLYKLQQSTLAYLHNNNKPSRKKQKKKNKTSNSKHLKATGDWGKKKRHQSIAQQDNTAQKPILELDHKTNDQTRRKKKNKKKKEKRTSNATQFIDRATEYLGKKENNPHCTQQDNTHQHPIMGRDHKTNDQTSRKNQNMKKNEKRTSNAKHFIVKTAEDLGKMALRPFFTQQDNPPQHPIMQRDHQTNDQTSRKNKNKKKEKMTSNATLGKEENPPSFMQQHNTPQQPNIYQFIVHAAENLGKKANRPFFTQQDNTSQQPKMQLDHQTNDQTSRKNQNMKKKETRTSNATQFIVQEAVDLGKKADDSSFAQHDNTPRQPTTELDHKTNGNNVIVAATEEWEEAKNTPFTQQFTKSTDKQKTTKQKTKWNRWCPSCMGKCGNRH